MRKKHNMYIDRLYVYINNERIKYHFKSIPVAGFWSCSLFVYRIDKLLGWVAKDGWITLNFNITWGYSTQANFYRYFSERFFI